jgi:DNA-binding transcriptional regulator YiaG
MNLVDKACKVYGMELPEFARHIDMPKSTLQTWKDNGKCSKIGEILLNALIELHELKKKDETVKALLALYGIKSN